MKKYIYFNDKGQKITFVGKRPIESKTFTFREQDYYLLKVVIENV